MVRGSGAAVSVDLEEFRLLGEALTESGWQQEARLEHRWRAPAGARVDLLPAGAGIRAAGRLEWPRSGMVMNLIGFEHVFRQAVTREAAPGIEVRVVPVPVLVLLKIAAFTDSPHSREKDAGDLCSMLERYQIEGDRRFGSDVYDAGLDYDRAGAFLLGQDLAEFCDAREVELVHRFVNMVQDESSSAAVVFARAAERPTLGGRGDHGRALVAAFAAGFGSAPEE